MNSMSAMKDQLTEQLRSLPGPEVIKAKIPVGVWVLLVAGWEGMLDALRVYKFMIFFLTSHTIRTRSCQCFLLNGVIFLGSLYLLDALLVPVMRYLLGAADLGSTGLFDAGNFVDRSFVALYYLLWVYPVYGLSFLLNHLWYQDIADQAYALRGNTPRKEAFSLQRFVMAISGEIYRSLLLGIFFLQVSLFGLIPWIGSILSFVYLAWLYAYMAFDYKWAWDGWDSLKRMKYFERHWPYLLGFGLPAAMTTIFFPKFMGAGIFALMFPVFITLAMDAKPVNHTAFGVPEDDLVAPRLPIFSLAKIVNLFALRTLGKASTNRQ